MADGFDIHLDEDQARRLKAAAEAAGVDPTAFALDLLNLGTRSDWTEDERRYAEYERTGEFVSPEAWLDGLREMIDDKFKA
jgi:hypothetical protein